MESVFETQRVMGDSVYTPNDAIPIIALGGFIAICVLWTLGLIAIGILKALKGGGRRSGKMDAEEAQVFQELQRGFRRMEERVESLETLIIDKSHKENFERELHR